LGVFIATIGLGGFGVSAFFAGKLIGCLSSIGLYHYFSKQSYFYFRNAGYHMRRVILNACVIDTLLNFAILIVATSI
jgi:hypothetical protein